MTEKMIEIGRLQLKSDEIKKYWVDQESAKARKIRLYYQDNHYLASVGSLLIAGVTSFFLSKKNRKQPPKQYLHIETQHNMAYCFSEDEIDINNALLQLKQ